MGPQSITADAVSGVSTINVTLLRQVLAHIETNPEVWDQGEWRCDTGMCFAGWTGELAGGKWITEADSMFAPYMVVERDDHLDHVRYLSEVGYAVDVEERATRLLGLTEDQADDLFTSANYKLDMLREEAAALIVQVRHVTIRLVPADELQLDEAMPSGRAPMEIVEHRPGQPPYLHGTERGTPACDLRERARAVADRLGIDYVDPISPDVMSLLAEAEAV